MIHVLGVVEFGSQTQTGLTTPELSQTLESNLTRCHAKSKNPQNLLRLMIMKNGKLSRFLTHKYTERSSNIVLNGLDLMKTTHGILPQTL